MSHINIQHGKGEFLAVIFSQKLENILMTGSQLSKICGSVLERG